MTRTETLATGSRARTRDGVTTAFTALVGLAALLVLLQGVWAGLFIREGQDFRDNWVEWHARGADVAIGLAAIAAVLAIVKLRHRRDLLVGSIVFTVLLALESYLGGIIGDSPGAEIVHFPLALALMGLAVWLPLRASRPRVADPAPAGRG